MGYSTVGRFAMLFFIHIPKTGGTSIYNALRTMLPDRLVWYTGPGEEIRNFLSNPENRLSKSVYAGHFTYSAIKKVPDSGDKIFSIVREPIERAFSHYNHISLRDTNHPLHLEIRNLSIKEAVNASPRFATEMSNHTCAYLSGTNSCEETKATVIAREMKLYSMNQLNLMVRDIAKECGVLRAPEIAFDNASENDYMSQVTREEMDFVKRLNEEDCKFYSYFMSDHSVPA